MFEDARKLWQKYQAHNWPLRWRITGMITRQLPAKWAAWQMNRNFARYDIRPLTMIWAESYLWFWVIVNGWYEEHDGTQCGWCEIVRKPKTKKEARSLARTFVDVWLHEAKKARGEAT
jgi:hypothetical protein